ncbi:hypothetical protein A2690_00505 [Candidatus Roizmanbacteria bacterium RIFCSPHIGHO2_01_FULL_39_12b]|uniref:DUF2000 domain-containing protein n=1 Tax=Candidatus Roizmanbacteria bacterium RIFCSPHIGHO2_01_FULL_39_12b TaxID=1802030 RepID=A0A1F7G8H9_9BACT|nr:MAG: hypothetical protein A2690_00505 [Candidatus Roizmanbacteria bacterium RIFCSPHIGHO2_01_FULL_39_12b]OGK46041.1 MAG: hypothetical protein A3B46_00795 [Candidatus Roizmanbacteria bacterium RIFCSPLOWO2_01_FULL_39_19]
MEEHEELKVVIVVSSTLGIGLAANRAAVLATGLAMHIPSLPGQNLVTKDGIELLGFTQIPIPILTAKPNISFLELCKRGEELGCKIIVFLTRAQGMRSYEEYKKSVAETNYNDLDIDAIAIYGDKKSVTKVTGSLPSLR